MPEHEALYRPDGTCTLRKDHVLGKALAWELLYCHSTGRFAREQELLDFLARYSDEMYRETRKYTGGGSDTATSTCCRPTAARIWRHPAAR